ncbi:MAG: zinc-binding dehydrogenase [Elusimicrobia bacterium]|nr:zinc-binding dehydrogenase [Elusimicrobiota bacterium]
MNTAKPEAGRSLAVFGAGGVGLCAIAAASISGCSPVVAVDVREEKLAAAKRMGATHAILAGKDGPLAELKKLCPAGFDFAVESSGRPATMSQALQCVRPRGGTAVVIGNAHHGESIAVDPKELNLGKRLLGTWGGDNEPDRDFPRYGELVRSGRLDLSPLLASRYTLRDINRALDDLEAGRAVRPVVDVSAA